MWAEQRAKLPLGSVPVLGSPPAISKQIVGPAGDGFLAVFRLTRSDAARMIPGRRSVSCLRRHLSTGVSLVFTT